MPEANFCQGCGNPLSVQPDTGLPKDPLLQPESPPSQQHLCFRCSAPLPADAKICEKCGLNVESLIKPHARKTPDLAEITFFSRPPPADPQMAALKTYAGWFAAILLAFFVSSAAYSWLEASNVISRLMGGGARDAQIQKFPLNAVESQKDSVSKAEIAELDSGNAEIGNNTKSDIKQDLAVSDVSSVATINEAVVTEPAAPRRRQSKSEAKPAVAKNAEVPAESNSQGSFNTESVNLQSTEQVSASETMPAPDIEQRQETALVDTEGQIPAAQPKPKKPVTVTQIEPSNGQRATPATEIEAFLRRLKKSVKQGVSDRPCTQQEKVLNQCY